VARYPIWLLGALALSCAATAAPAGMTASIDAFNAAFADATRHLDNMAALQLWDDEGVELLPETQPLIGKRAIARFLDDVVKQLPGAHMVAFEMRCAGVEVAGDWASEWCDEHQKVELGGGKPPFEGRGRLLLVLHRGGDGNWRLRREMWNRAPASDATAAPRK